MVRIGVALRLALLGHDVGDVNLQGIGFGDGLGHALHQQIGDDAGIQAAGTQEDHVRLPDGLQSALQGRRTFRQQAHPPDAAVLPFLAVEDFRLAQDLGAIFKLCLQLDVGGGHREHPAGDGQDLAHAADRLIEAAAGNTVEGRQEQVAEALPLEGALGEAVVEQLSHQGLHVGQGFQAVSHVPRRQHPQFLAEYAGAAAVVRHRDDGGEVVGVPLQTPQHGGEARSAADGDDLRPLSAGAAI